MARVFWLVYKSEASCSAPSLCVSLGLNLSCSCWLWILNRNGWLSLLHRCSKGTGSTDCVLISLFSPSGTAAVFHCLRTMLFFFVSQAQQRYLTACALCYFFCISGTAVGFPACVLCYFSVSQAQQLDFTACVLVCLSCISGTAAGSHCLHSWRFCFCRCSSSSTLNGQSVSCFWRRGKHQRHRREYGNDLCRCRARKAGSGTGPRAGSCHC